MITVRLTWNEILVGASVGALRFMMPVVQGQANRYGAKNDWTNDINSCLAEMAVARTLGQYWHAAPASYTGSNRNYEQSQIKNDVGESLEIRTSRTHKLIIRKGDDDEKTYVLVGWPEFDQKGAILKIYGGIQGKTAKQSKYEETFGKNNRPPCFAVPPSDLVSAEALFGKETEKTEQN